MVFLLVMTALAALIAASCYKGDNYKMMCLLAEQTHDIKATTLLLATAYLSGIVLAYIAQGALNAAFQAADPSWVNQWDLRLVASMGLFFGIPFLTTLVGIKLQLDRLCEM